MKHINLGKLEPGGKAVELKMPSSEGFQLTAIGSSGSGKTHMLYRIVEQIPKDRPIFIADPEQDFVQLRRHRDLVLVGKGRDIPADPNIAGKLAKHFLEQRFSIVFDAFEEKKENRELFLKYFLEALHDAPRSLWGPATILLDELDVWAPESGEGFSRATEACAYAAKRFRKRGFDLIMATQRAAAVDKTVISQSRNMLIGLSNLDIDIKRSLSFLGFTEKEDRVRYRDLQRGEFFARGPELGLRRPELVLIGGAALYQKQSKSKKGLAPAPKGEVTKLLKALKDLPKEVAEETNTIAALRNRVATLEVELKSGKADRQDVMKAVQLAVAQNETIWRRRMAQGSRQRQKILSLIEELKNAVAALPSQDTPTEMVFKAPIQDLTRKSFKALAQEELTKPFLKARPDGPTTGLGKSERKILKFLAMREGRAFSKAQIGALTGFAPRGGSFNTYLSRLRSAGLVDAESGLFQVADGARAREVLGEEYHAPEKASLEHWLSELGGGAKSIYEVLYQNPSSEFTKEELGQAVNMEPKGGSFNTYISRLCSLGLAERTNRGVRLNQELLSI